MKTSSENQLPANEKWVHLVDGGELEYIGLITIHSVSVENFRCAICGLELNISDYDHIGPISEYKEGTMKTIAYSAVHYGASFLGASIRSIIDHVDAYYVLYSPQGSHGTRISEPCPESREQLYAIARQAAGDKLLWVDGTWTQEGQQRESILKICPDADVIVVLDADEIYPDGLVPELIAQTSAWGKRAIRVPMVHFFRSFYRAVIHDPAYPPRIIYPRIKDGEATAQCRPIAHMGYAQPTPIVKYKLKIHGHRAELRTDIDWFKERWLVNAQQDCHVVGSQYWNPEPVNPWNYLPEWMQDHPFAYLEVIP